MSSSSIRHHSDCVIDAKDNTPSYSGFVECDDGAKKVRDVTKTGVDNLSLKAGEGHGFSTSWTGLDDDILIYLREKETANFTAITPTFPGRTPHECRERYEYLRSTTSSSSSMPPNRNVQHTVKTDPPSAVEEEIDSDAETPNSSTAKAAKSKASRWTPTQDAALIAYLEQRTEARQPLHWDLIAQEMRVHHDKDQCACRGRYARLKRDGKLPEDAIRSERVMRSKANNGFAVSGDSKPNLDSNVNANRRQQINYTWTQQEDRKLITLWLGLMNEKEIADGYMPGKTKLMCAQRRVALSEGSEHGSLYAELMSKSLNDQQWFIDIVERTKNGEDCFGDRGAIWDSASKRVR